MIVSQSQVPPVVSGGHIPIFGLSYGPSQGFPHIPNYGHSHGTPYGASHGQSYGPQYGKNYQPYEYGYQQPAYSSNYGFVVPHNQGTRHHNASL